MSFLERLRQRAASVRRRVVFPESADPRTLAAVRRLVDEGIVAPVLVLDPNDPASHDVVRALGVEVRDPLSDPVADAAAERLFARRRTPQLTKDECLDLIHTPLWFADALVAAGDVDGCVAGAVHTTADVLRAALRVVGKAEGMDTVSSSFYMVTPSSGDGRSEVLTFTDCAVVRYPDASELADIAIAAAADRLRIVGDEPVVAFLSFSTHGSAEGASVSMVREAVEAVRARAPHLAVDGELQGDAALASAVATRKAPGSVVAGRANVLVFPSLDAGNIAYKLVQRLAGASAIGPIIQGLRRPCNDLSRGAVVEDIINVAAITALQASGATAENESREGR